MPSSDVAQLGGNASCQLARKLTVSLTASRKLNTTSELLDIMARPTTFSYHDGSHLVAEREVMRFYDVSVPISTELATYPGDPPVEIHQWMSLASGDSANLTRLNFGAHTGTHVDAPLHFIEHGKSVAEMDLETLIGEVQVIEIPDNAKIIDQKIVSQWCSPAWQRVLFKTRNSLFWNEDRSFRSDYTHLSPDGARKLVDNGVRLVGIDYLSIEKFQPSRFETHEILLSHGVVIIETLDLRAVPAGPFELICLPLKIAAEGAPARVVLRTLD